MKNDSHTFRRLINPQVTFDSVFLYRAVQKYLPLLVDDILLKIDERTKIFLWKVVKCFYSDVQNPSVTVPADIGRPRPIFNFFAFQKKCFLGGILLVKIPIV